MYEKGDVLGFSLKEEGERVNIVGNDITIWQSYFSVTPEQVENFEKGDVDLGVGFGYGVLLFAHKTGNAPWIDFTYSYHYSYWLYKTGQDIFIEPSLEFLKDDEPLLLKIYLMDTGTTTIMAKRVLELPPHIRKEIIKGFKAQKYGKVPFIQSLTEDAKVQAYKQVTEFIQQQPIESIVKNLKRHTFKA